MATIVEKLHGKMIMMERDAQVPPAPVVPGIGIFSIPAGNMGGNIPITPVLTLTGYSKISETQLKLLIWDQLSSKDWEKTDAYHFKVTLSGLICIEQ